MAVRCLCVKVLLFSNKRDADEQSCSSASLRTMPCSPGSLDHPKRLRMEPDNTVPRYCPQQALPDSSHLAVQALAPNSLRIHVLNVENGRVQRPSRNRCAQQATYSTSCHAKPAGQVAVAVVCFLLLLLLLLLLLFLRLLLLLLLLLLSDTSTVNSSSSSSAAAEVEVAVAAAPAPELAAATGATAAAAAACKAFSFTCIVSTCVSNLFCCHRTWICCCCF